MQKVRVDKWLWSVRIFKSRTMAANACKNGKIKINGTTLKPSSFVQKGDVLQVRKEHFNFSFKVVELIEKRVSAKLAEPCYENLTPPDEMNKFKSFFLGNLGQEYREKGTGRPTKKERRVIDEFKGDEVPPVSEEFLTEIQGTEEVEEEELDDLFDFED